MTRDVWIIGSVCAIAIALGAWLFLAGSQEGEVSGSLTPRVIAEGQYSGYITERANYRIENADELFELWRMVYATGGPALPPIDFETNEVLAVFDGTHSSGGYGISVLSVEDEPGVARHVTILHREPGESCVTSQAITSPFEVVVLPRSGLPISRTDITETVSCE